MTTVSQEYKDNFKDRTPEALKKEMVRQGKIKKQYKNLINALVAEIRIFKKDYLVGVECPSDYRLTRNEQAANITSLELKIHGVNNKLGFISDTYQSKSQPIKQKHKSESFQRREFDSRVDNIVRQLNHDPKLKAEVLNKLKEIN